ncbi:MAG TPA: hypothetical protein VFF04_00960 [Candidatus Babeliales bacterium]|nr:hypothetical protein [Candidatus Babeliales bacterium]
MKKLLLIAALSTAYSIYAAPAAKFDSYIKKSTFESQKRLMTEYNFWQP